MTIVYRSSVRLALASAALFFISTAFARAQETVFNVPSADVLDRGKVYLEVDNALQSTTGDVATVPRLVAGVGYNVEAGFNLGPFSTATGTIRNFSPTIKYKPYEKKKNGFSFFVGDNVYIPLDPAPYSAASYTYAAMAKKWKKTRITGGGYFFSKNLVANGYRGGGQFSLEQQLMPKVSAAVDWFTGNTSTSYVTPGLVISLPKRITLFPAYEIGNHHLSEGNHYFLFEIGWNIN